MNRNEIAGGENFLHAARLGLILRQHIRRNIEYIVGIYLHPNAVSHSGHILSDISEADDAHALSCQLKARGLIPSYHGYQRHR